MARQKLGAFARIKRRKADKLAEKQKAIEKAVEKAEAAATVAEAPIAEVTEALATARAEATSAENKAINAEAAGPKLVSPAKVQSLKKQAKAKAVVVEQLEEKVQVAEARPPAAVVQPPSDLEASLTMFEWSLILLAVGAETLKISKWYAVGGAAALAALYFLAEKQGWLDFLNF